MIFKISGLCLPLLNVFIHLMLHFLIGTPAEGGSFHAHSSYFMWSPNSYFPCTQFLSYIPLIDMSFACQSILPLSSYPMCDLPYNLTPLILLYLCKWYTCSSLILLCLQSLPNFGPYKEEREKRIASLKISQGLPQPGVQPRLIEHPESSIPSVEDVVGRALPMVGTYGELDNRQQKVALIDEARKQQPHSFHLRSGSLL